MAGIFALSDLHLGAPTSYLNLVSVRSRLIEKLKELSGGHLNVLCLVGDIIDLTVGSFPKAWVIAKEFFELLNELDIDHLFYIPGNHDHHLWVMLVENKFLGNIENIMTNKNKLTDKFPYWTPIHDIFPKELAKKTVFSYPVHLLHDRITGTRLVFHHGHYLDPSITPLAKRIAKDYQDLEKIEAYNLPYIESLFYFCSWDPAVQSLELNLYDKIATISYFWESVKRIIVRIGSIAKLYEDEDVPPRTHSPDRIELLKKCVDRITKNVASRQIWIVGHSHKRSFPTDPKSAFTLFDLGGWVFNKTPRKPDNPDNDMPGIFKWNSGDYGELIKFNIAAEEINNMAESEKLPSY